MAVIWGIPYLLIKVAVGDVSPVVVVVARCVIGAALLLPWAIAKGWLRPALRHWRALLLFTALEMTLPWLLLSWAETSLSSSLTGLLVASVPFVAALTARLAGDEDRLTAVRVAGMLLGLVGIVALLALPRLGQVADASGRAVLSLLVLGVVCTALALALFFALIREVGPQRALVITFLNPAVAVLLGVLLLDEPFTLGLALGLPLVVLGCALATRRSPARQAVPVPDAVESTPRG